METNYIRVMVDTNRDRKQMAWQGWLYAVQRIDLLIISISGAGVYVCLETLKYHKQDPLDFILSIKAAGLCFVVAMVVNLISQFTGKSANKFDMRMCQAKIDDAESPSEETKRLIAVNDCKADTYSKCTDILNLSSLLIMFSGLITLITFFMISL
jgi:hypothetical protein